MTWYFTLLDSENRPIRIAGITRHHVATEEEADRVGTAWADAMPDVAGYRAGQD